MLGCYMAAWAHSECLLPARAVHAGVPAWQQEHLRLGQAGWEWAVMARAIWTGVITFGLVSVPVGLYTAVGDHTVHFHQLQRGSADRVRNRRVNERTGKEVLAEDIVKGFEVAEGEYVVEPDELDEIAPGRSQAIDISEFVELGDVEPVYFDRTYYIAPAARSTPRSMSCCGRRWRRRARPASPRS